MADISAELVDTRRVFDLRTNFDSPEVPDRRSVSVTHPAFQAAAGGTPSIGYAVALARLLEAADAAVAEDPRSARDYLATAIAILQPHLDRQSSTEKPVSRAVQRVISRGGLAPWQIRRVVDYIDANLTSSLRGNDLAHIAKLSGSYFVRAFKASFGEPPHAFVMRRRVARAKALMLDTEEPLGRIAVACGFADQAHFCRQFLRQTGQRPKNWRTTRHPGRG